MMSRLGALKTWYATGGALLAAVVLATLVIAVLPLPADLAFAIGAHAVVPLWVTFACTLPLLARHR